ncbi:hypothetical protein EYF80_030502 [Liparis tanakae]|uniref:Uncharacterized protein n=1 Tax=Liparis tanakae TaxID=230148 RepID=A0A4Z2H3C7_9TELE|nr:hypothetical protein EYF80_030502 [Liparis tanakae]
MPPPSSGRGVHPPTHRAEPMCHPGPRGERWGDKDGALGGREGSTKFTFPRRAPRERDRTQLRRSRSSCGKLPI